MNIYEMEGGRGSTAAESLSNSLKLSRPICTDCDAKRHYTGRENDGRTREYTLTLTLLLLYGIILVEKIIK